MAEKYDPQLAKGTWPVGKPPEALEQQDELGEIVSYDPQSVSYCVLTRGSGGRAKQSGGRALKNVPCKNHQPGTSSPYSEGTIVLINNRLGFPFIDGCLNIDPKVPDGTIKPPALSPNYQRADTSQTAPASGGGYYGDATTPLDILSGDWVHTTPDGNRIGALRGKYCFLDGGPGTKASVEVFGDRDMIRFRAENLVLETGFGTLEIFNSGGRCGLRLRGGSDQLTQSGGAEEAWTFKLDIGDEGDFFKLEVCGSDGATKGLWHISPDGKMDTIATNGYSVTNANPKTPMSFETASDFFLKIAGMFKAQVSGDISDTCGGSRTVTTGEVAKKTVGGNDVTSVGNHQIESVAGNRETVITGGPTLEAKPTNIAIQMQVLNGSSFIELGNPKSGANPAAKAGYTVVVHNGNITLGENPSPLGIPSMSASVSLNTKLPGSVALGGTSPLNPSTNIAVFHAVLYEQLLSVLTQLCTIVDTHTHICAEPTKPSITPLPLVSPIVSPMFINMMSKRVLIGG